MIDHQRTMTRYHMAQVNIGRAKAPLDGPIMSGFVSRLDEINALADRAPGFVWRLQTSEGNATYYRPYDDDRILVNMSVWETPEALKQFVYRTAHAELLRQRRDWFENFESAFVALWWVPAGHLPGIDEAKKRLEYLDTHGPTQFAFTFKTIFPPDEEFQQRGRLVLVSAVPRFVTSSTTPALDPRPLRAITLSMV